MKTNRSQILLTLFFFLTSSLLAQNIQTNNFHIGIFADSWDRNYTGPNNRSCFPVIKEDGFDLVYTFNPGQWDPSIDNHKDLIREVKINGLKLVDTYQEYFRRDLSGNYYLSFDDNNCPTDALFNYDDLLSSIENDADPDLKNAVWGHQIGGELSDFNHYYRLNGCNFNSTDHLDMDPQLFSDAVGHFKNLNINTHYLFDEACHGGFISDNLNDGSGNYNPQDYMNEVTPTGHVTINNYTRPDIYIDESYFSTAFRGWNTHDGTNPGFDYLGKFRSVDYARRRFSTVHAQVAAELPGFYYTDRTYLFHYHSFPDIRNANALWFQVYTSIIHRVQGIWIYALGAMWDYHDPDDMTNKSAFGDPVVDGFNRVRFPLNYNRYARNLAKELRYLVNENLLNDDQHSVVYTKTDADDGSGGTDPNCIIQTPYTTYLPACISQDDIRDYLAVISEFPTSNTAGTCNTHGVINGRRDNYHSLRYTVRTNPAGTDALMIVSNPNPYSVHDITFNFDKVSNPVLRSSTQVDVLFNDQPGMSVNDVNYKVENNTEHHRDFIDQSTFNLRSNGKYTKPFISHTRSFKDDFGPFDTKVYRFTNTQPSYANGWQKKWTNFGSGSIDGWNISPSDKFIPIDVDGDGTEELLCIQSFAQNNYVAVLKYYEYEPGVFNWTWYFDNHGNGWLNDLNAGWKISPGDKFIAGDFDNDGISNELLCIQGSTHAYATILQFQFGQLAQQAGHPNQKLVVWYWTNAGNGTLDGWGIRAADKFSVGDLDADGFNNDVLCIQGDGTYWGVYHFDKNFLPARRFVWVYDGPDNFKFNSVLLWKIKSDDQFILADFDGDGIKRELMCVDRNGGYQAAIMIFKNFTTLYGWNYIWNNGAGGSIAGWGNPLNPYDKIIVGDIDHKLLSGTDPQEEIMFIQRCGNPGCSWATTEDYKGTLRWNWCNHASVAADQDYIDDWKVDEQQVSNTNYFFIRPVATEDKWLMCMRDYGCTQHSNTIASMYRATNTTNYRVFPAEKNSTAKYRIAPNPAQNEVDIAALNEIEDWPDQIEIVTVQGNVLLQLDASDMRLNGKMKIHVDQLKNGYYYLRLAGKHEVSYLPMLILH